MFFLDTNVIIAVMNGRDTQIDARLQQEITRCSALFVPMPVLFELRYGAEKSLFPAKNHQRIEVFLSAMTGVVDFDRDDADEAGKIRADLEKLGTPIGPYDLLIAAQARKRNAILVTLNLRKFERIPGLMLTNWR